MLLLLVGEGERVLLLLASLAAFPPGEAVRVRERPRSSGAASIAADGDADLPAMSLVCYIGKDASNDSVRAANLKTGNSGSRTNTVCLQAANIYAQPQKLEERSVRRGRTTKSCSKSACDFIFFGC